MFPDMKGSIMKLYPISRKTLEQAERMQAKWEFREEEFYHGDEPKYCNTVEEADECQRKADEISDALSLVRGSYCSPVAPWSAIDILKKAQADRDLLDSMIINNKN